MSELRIGEATHRMGEARCLACGYAVDAATVIEARGEEARGPGEGDITICLRCGHVMIYADDKGGVRDPTDEEIVELAGDERIVAFNTIRGPSLEAFDRLPKRLKSLPEAPRRVARLPTDGRGYPVPWFIQWMKDGEPCKSGDGEPDFRMIDERKRAPAFKKGLCWICGEPMGVHRVYPIGPMCVVNRTTMEPASHRDCVEYAVKACPFLARPRMRRLPSEDLEGKVTVPGDMLERNPGAVCLYETREARPFDAGNGWLIRLGAPTRVDWWAEGRKATRAEIEASIASGLPSLMEIAKREGEAAMAELERLTGEAMKLLPAA